MTWQAELRRQSEKYHRIGAWVAIILNPVWAIGDYLEIPDYWQQFFIIRCVVTLLTLVTFALYKPLKIAPEWMIFVPFLGIALQNAYMYSVMPVDILQKHTFAYIALFIGAGMLVLWRPVYSIVIVAINFVANVIFFYYQSNLEIKEVLINGGMLTASVSIFTILLIHTRYNLTRKEIMARLKLEESRKEIENQKHIIEHAHNEVRASINYAERIQMALLDGDESWERIGSDRFIMFKPRDVVSGDFYWAFSTEKVSIWAVADCTGHGVPGAFMSMLGIGFLNEIVAEGGETDPAEILGKLRRKIIKSLEQKGNEQRKDGMDIALCVWHRDSDILEFSGAYNPLLIITKDPKVTLGFAIDQDQFDKKVVVMEPEENSSSSRTLIEIKGDKMPIGSHINNSKQFSSIKIQLQESDLLYTFSDGIQDQFGGPNGKKYMIKQMKRLLRSHCESTLTRQCEIISGELESWMITGKTQQTDDVCMVGIKVL